MKQLDSFLTAFTGSLNPSAYAKLSKQPLSSSLKYFFCLLLFTMAVMIVVSIPTMLSLPDTISNELQKLDTLDITVSQHASSEIAIPENIPLIVYAPGTAAETEKTPVLITDSIVAFKLPLQEPIVFPYTGGSLLQNRRSVGTVLAILLLLLLPGILILLYMLLSIKYLAIIIISTLLGLLLAGFIRFSIKFRELLNVGLYAATLMILIELLTRPFLVKGFFFQYIVFGVYFILGMVGAGEFETVEHKKKSKEGE